MVITKYILFDYSRMSWRYLLVISKEDSASSNIMESLLELEDWDEQAPFDSNPAYLYGKTLMVQIEKFHLYNDNIDEKIFHETGKEPEIVIFASRHRSESGLKTLTIHPIGNFSEAKFGGIPDKLVPSAPRKMAQALRVLKDKGSELEHKISFEATHHGPFLKTPAFFIEIGSDSDAWVEKVPAVAIARTLLQILEEPIDEKDRIAVGVGGGHYVPRLTDVVLSHHVAFGHMIPNYAVDLPWDKFQTAVENTPGADCVYFHKKALKKSRYREIVEWFEKETDLDIVDSKELEKR